jgi:predicted RNA-binding protein
MCLAKAYISGKDGESILEDIARIRIDGDRVQAVTLFGQEEVIIGRLLEVDFSRSRVIVEPYE